MDTETLEEAQWREANQRLDSSMLLGKPWLKEGWADVETLNVTTQDAERPTKRRCTGTNKAGNPCSMPPRLDAETCLVHSMTPEERSAKAKEASTKSTEVRQSRAEKRQERVEASKHSLTEWFSIAAGEQAEALARKAVSQALDGDVRALSIVLERVEGKVTDHIAIDGNAPAEMAMDDLVAWLSTTVDSA